MTKKWRESLTNPDVIKFNNGMILKQIVSYPPAGNDVFECIMNINNRNYRTFLKISRGVFADIENEVKVLLILSKLNIKVPKVLDYGKIYNYEYIVTTKMYGAKLSNLVKRGVNSIDYLFDYGKMLACIHSLDIKTKIAKQRKINDIVEIDSKENSELENIYQYLINNYPEIEFDTFIHGDFHYGNLLFKNKKINGVIDWEYSGIGFKEQDIAWSIILRPNQKFLNTYEEIEMFLAGYKSLGVFDINKFKWCYINGCLHFYKMNKNNLSYCNELLMLINLMKEKF